MCSLSVYPFLRLRTDTYLESGHRLRSSNGPGENRSGARTRWVYSRVRTPGPRALPDGLGPRGRPRWQSRFHTFQTSSGTSSAKNDRVTTTDIRFRLNCRRSRHNSASGYISDHDSTQDWARTRSSSSGSPGGSPRSPRRARRSRRTAAA